MCCPERPLYKCILWGANRFSAGTPAIYCTVQYGRFSLPAENLVCNAQQYPLIVRPGFLQLTNWRRMTQYNPPTTPDWKRRRWEQVRRKCHMETDPKFQPGPSTSDRLRIDNITLSSFFCHTLFWHGSNNGYSHIIFIPPLFNVMSF